MNVRIRTFVLDDLAHAPHFVSEEMSEKKGKRRKWGRGIIENVGKERSAYKRYRWLGLKMGDRLRYPVTAIVIFPPYFPRLRVYITHHSTFALSSSISVSRVHSKTLYSRLVRRFIAAYMSVFLSIHTPT